MTAWKRVRTRERCAACQAAYAAYYRDPSTYDLPPRARPAAYRHTTGRLLCADHYAQEATT